MESEAHRGNFCQYPALISALAAPSLRRESGDALQAGIGDMIIPLPKRGLDIAFQTEKGALPDIFNVVNP